MKKANFVRFGPEIPIVPVSDFDKIGLTDEQWANLWHVCGPSVERNMHGGMRHKSLELWQVIAAAYMEGLLHGHGIAQEHHAKSTVPHIPNSRTTKESLRKGEDYWWDGIPCG